MFGERYYAVPYECEIIDGNKSASDIYSFEGKAFCKNTVKVIPHTIIYKVEIFGQVVIKVVSFPVNKYGVMSFG